MAEQKVDLQMGQYRESTLTSQYKHHRGILLCPVMGPAGTAPGKIRTHAGYGVREVDFAYTKEGTPPMIPAPVNTTSGDVIVGETLTIDVARPAPNDASRMLYSIQGQYLFVQPNGGRGATDTFPLDKHPFYTPLDEMITPDAALAGRDLTKTPVNLSVLRTPGNANKRLVEQALNAVWVANVFDPNYLSTTNIIG